MSDVHLEDLFHECDRHGEGRIGPDEFRELCAKFEIGPGDADAIFADLDRDGDGQICLEDFALGFRDFLSAPGKPDRSGGGTVADAGGCGPDRRSSNAWAHFVASIGEPALQKLFHTRYERNMLGTRAAKAPSVAYEYAQFGRVRPGSIVKHNAGTPG